MLHGSKGAIRLTVWITPTYNALFTNNTFNDFVGTHLKIIVSDVKSVYLNEICFRRGSTFELVTALFALPWANLSLLILWFFFEPLFGKCNLIIDIKCGLRQLFDKGLPFLLLYFWSHYTIDFSIPSFPFNQLYHHFALILSKVDDVEECIPQMPSAYYF